MLPPSLASATSPRLLSPSPVAIHFFSAAPLRCDDCITYHIVPCAQGWTRSQVIDALNVVLVVGGSITIPHVRRAFATMRDVPGLLP
jgi:hypothetical protein